MAIQVRSRTEKRGSSGSSGSGRSGQLLGALAGAAIAGGAAYATGGAAPAVAGAALGGSGTGMGLGGMLGETVDPARPDTRQAIERRVASMGQSQPETDPQTTMKQAILALREINDPNLTKQYAPPLAQGLMLSMGQKQGGV